MIYVMQLIGVLEANFIEPTHNKQDFEKTSVFQRLEDRLRQMAHEYWWATCSKVFVLREFLW